MHWGNRHVECRVRLGLVGWLALASCAFLPVAGADPLTVEWAIQFEVVAPAESGARGFAHAAFDMDAAGNLYIVGAFSGTMDFDPSPEIAELTSVDDGEIFIVKLDPDGAFVWMQHLESSQGSNGSIDADTLSLAVDPDGNIHIAGTFRGRVDMDPSLSTHRLTSVTTSGDGFVLKLDADGAFVWAQHLVATEAAITGIAVDALGNIAIAGNFFGAADLDPGPETFTLNSLLNTSHFVCQWDADGAFVWANQLRATTASSSARGDAIALDNNGNVYTAGTLQFSVEFENDPIKAIVASATSVFLAKFGADGAVEWVRQFEQTDVDTPAYRLEIGFDGPGNIVLTGVFTGGMDADPGASAFSLAAPPGEPAVITIALTPSGNFRWADVFAAAGGIAGVTTSSAVGLDGKVVTVGAFSDTVIFEAGDEPFELTSAGETDAYARVLFADGGFDTALSVGSEGVDSASGVLTTADGAILVLGMFSGSVDFDLGPGVATLTAPDEGHTFIMKLSELPCEPPAAPTGLNASDGTHEDAVELSWDAVEGNAIEYRLFRNTSNDRAGAVAVSEWIEETAFLDDTAEPPTPGPLNCSGEPIPTFNTYYYWVQAREAGAFCASESSESDSGYRGTGAAVVTADAGVMCAVMLGLFAGLGVRRRRT